MKKGILLIALLMQLGVFLRAQKTFSPTESVLITGDIKKEVTLSWEAVDSFAWILAGDVVITNHLGEMKSTKTGVKGIPLKSFLKNLEFNTDSPKYLSEFYFIFQAADGYKVVYSWNEIFNTATGDYLFLITEMDGKPISQMEERMAILTPTDFMTGRRFVKNLEKIIVKRVE